MCPLTDGDILQVKDLFTTVFTVGLFKPDLLEPPSLWVSTNEHLRAFIIYLSLETHTHGEKEREREAERSWLTD